jgi:radical SAM/Cys-rich protein
MNTEVATAPAAPKFDDTLRGRGLAPLRRGVVETVQVNVGRLCNMACHHCHVDAGPNRAEQLVLDLADRILSVVAASPGVSCVDLTGGAPELNSSFRRLVRVSRRLGLRVIDRCNLTVMFEPGQEDLAAFLADQEVEVVASLPCYLEANVDRQRGRGAFERSIEALRRLNEHGYGTPGGPILNLVYNPTGASLPPGQGALQAAYRDALAERFGVHFNRLLTLTNMPIRRFAQQLVRKGQLDAYMGLLVNHFNADTIPALMCRSLVSVSWDGALYDCDFNQMVGVRPPIPVRSIWKLGSFAELTGATIATAQHCFGCTAGAGSSCGGALR